MLFSFLLVSQAAFAHPTILYRKCIHVAMTQTAMNLCAYAETRRVDKKLHETYQRLLFETKNQQSLTLTIRDMERSWITYRDQFMSAMYPDKDKEGEYGSIFPFEENRVLAKLTQDHIDELRILVTQYNPTAQGLNIP